MIIGDEARFQNVPYMSVEDHQISNLTLYPNPINDFLYLYRLSQNGQKVKTGKLVKN
ncbi:MAG TPA: hypothetical protein VK021_03000 [Flavobacteriaceae bacterium]|nr:hypothetical protein [Flavobacteriaceae bacterium]